MSEMLEQAGATEIAEPAAVPSETVEIKSEAEVQSGVNEEIASSSESPASEQTELSPEDRKAAFDKLVNEQYKDEYTTRVKDALGKRFKKHDTELAELQGKTGALDELMKAFGVDDVESLKELARTEAVKKKAYDLDIPEDVVAGYEAQLAAKDKELSTLKGESQTKQAEEYLTKLETEIMGFAKEIPGLTELDIIEDAALLDRVKNGESVKQAYFGLYPDKAQALISEAAKKQLAAELNKGKGRPSENITGDSKPATGTPKLSQSAMMKLMDRVKESGRPGDPGTGKLK